MITKRTLERLLSKLNAPDNGRLNISVDSEDIKEVKAVKTSTGPNGRDFCLDFIMPPPTKAELRLLNRMKRYENRAFRFKPKKSIANDGGTGLSNGTRADNASDLVSQVAGASHDERDIETNIVDTLANIFHLCDRDGLDVEDVISTAKMHWQEER